MGKIPQEPRLGRPLSDPRSDVDAGDEPRLSPGPAEDLRLEVREGVGDVLRRTREGFREDLNLVAQTLKIRYAYLKAIEDRSYQDLPGPTYAVGFVRTYGEYLGLDSADLVRRFKEEVEGVDRRQALHFPTPAPESRLPGGAVLLVSLLLVGAAYGGWFYLSDDESQVADLVPPVPDDLQALIVDAPGGVGSVPAREPTGPATTLGGSGSPLTGAPARTATADPAPDGMTAGAPAGIGAETEATAEQETIVEPAEPVSVSAADAVAAVPQDGPVPLEVAPPPDRDGATSGAADETAALRAQADAGLSGTGASGTDGSDAGQAAAGPQRITLDRVLAGGGQPEPGTAAAEPAEQPPVRVDTTPVDDGETMTIPDAPEATQIAALANEPAPQVYGADNEDARIVLRARQDSWVQIRDGEDELLLTRVLRRGDEYRVPNRDGLTLRTGNAGGIEILVDGAPMSPIGPVGSVRGDVSLDPDNLLGGGQNR